MTLLVALRPSLLSAFSLPISLPLVLLCVPHRPAGIVKFSTLLPFLLIHCYRVHSSPPFPSNQFLLSFSTKYVASDSWLPVLLPPALLPTSSHYLSPPRHRGIPLPRSLFCSCVEYCEQHYCWSQRNAVCIIGPL